MKGRKATPNIMDELLNIKVSNPTDLNQQDSIPEQHNIATPEQHNTATPEQHNIATPEQHNTATPEQHNTATPEQHNTVIAEQHNTVNKSLLENKTKATYYVSQKLIDEMDEAWFDLRRLLKPTDRGKFSKSLFVELAVKKAIEEFRINGEKSGLVQEIINITSEKIVS